MAIDCPFWTNTSATTQTGCAGVLSDKVLFSTTTDNYGGNGPFIMHAGGSKLVAVLTYGVQGSSDFAGLQFESTDAGATWEQRSTPFPYPSQLWNYNKINHNHDNYLSDDLVLGLEISGDNTYTTSRNGGLSWESKRTFSGVQWGTSLSVSPTGRLWMAGVISAVTGDASIKYSDDWGETWTTDGTITTPKFTFAVLILAVSDTEVYVCGRSYSPTDRIEVFRKNGGSYTQCNTINTASYTDTPLQMVQHSDGDVMLLYVTSDDTRRVAKGRLDTWTDVWKTYSTDEHGYAWLVGDGTSQFVVTQNTITWDHYNVINPDTDIQVHAFDFSHMPAIYTYKTNELYSLNMVNGWLTMGGNVYSEDIVAGIFEVSFVFDRWKYT